MNWNCPYSPVAVIAAVLICAGSSVASASHEVERGLQALRSGDVERAIRLWTTAIDRNPKSYAAHVNRGSAYIQSGYVFRGITDWHQARKLSPMFAFGLYGGGFIMQASGNTSMLNYAAPLELDPDHIASVIMTGVTFLDLGLDETAAALYRKSMDLTKNPLLKNYLEHWIETLER
ncbi:MAG: tetratricopeptide repeat protein [Pseudomonadota bacterium]